MTQAQPLILHSTKFMLAVEDFEAVPLLYIELAKWMQGKWTKYGWRTPPTLERNREFESNTDRWVLYARVHIDPSIS